MRANRLVCTSWRTKESALRLPGARGTITTGSRPQGAGRGPGSTVPCTPRGGHSAAPRGCLRTRWGVEAALVTRLQSGLCRQPWGKRPRRNEIKISAKPTRPGEAADHFTPRAAGPLLAGTRPASEVPSPAALPGHWPLGAVGGPCPRHGAAVFPCGGTFWAGVFLKAQRRWERRLSR